jgi:hypothetical protein
VSAPGRRLVLVASACGAIAAAVPARAGEGVDTDALWEEIEGEIRAGWRLLGDEGDGRFLEDRSLAEGPLLFDLSSRGVLADTSYFFREFEVEAHGIGDQEQDARVALRDPGTLDFSGRWMRDDFSYRATGDPYPYDTVRERYDTRVRFTPRRDLTLRLDWSRSLRRGDAYVEGYTELREPPPPQGVDREIVGVHRPLSQQGDTLTFGADARAGIWRFSLEETVRLGQVDDTRSYDVPPPRRGDVPLREALRRELRTTGWTTLGKAGTTLLDGTLDVDLIGAWTTQPTESRISGSARGYDTADEGGIDRGEFRGTTDGENDVDRQRTEGRLEARWRVVPEVEVTGAYEQEDTWDDAELRLTETRRYVRPDVGRTTSRRSLDARITDRWCRGSLEAAWDATDDVRLRLGEEYVRHNLHVPTDTRTAEFEPTNFSSSAWRTVAGIDVEPVSGLDLSLLARLSTDDEPHAAPSPERADEVTFRGRWRAAETLSLTAAYRHLGYTHDTDYDSSARTDSGTLAATWTWEGWTVAPTVTYQTADTRTDTTYLGVIGGSFRQIDDQVSFETRDLIASLDVEYAFTKTLRGFLRATRIEARGDEEETWDDLTLGAEHDLSERWTVGAAFRSWRLDERDRTVDDYRVVGAEAWVTFRF